MITSSFVDIIFDPEKITQRINEKQLTFFKEHIEPLIETHLLGEVLAQEVHGETPDSDLTPETFMDGSFITLFKEDFHQAERELILRLSEGSEHIKFGFAHYALLNDESRFLFAQSSVEKQRAAAWECANLKYPFGKFDDQQEISRDRIAASVFPNTAVTTHPYPYYNIASAVTGILEDDGAIAENEKNMISNLAAYLIVSGAPDETAKCGIENLADMNQEIEDQCHDLAYIETAIEALFITYNEIEGNENTLEDPTVISDLQPFWDKTYYVLKTNEARQYFNILKDLSERDVPLLFPDNVMDYAQGRVLANGAAHTHARYT